MNEFNFLNSISEKKQLSFYRWIKISFLLFFNTLSIILFLQLKNIFELKKISSEKLSFEKKLINFDEVVKEKNKLKEYKKEIEEKYLKLIKKSSISNKSLLFNILSEIIQIIPENLYLQSLEYNSKKGAIIKGNSYEIDTIIRFVQDLTKKVTFFENVKLNYVKYNENLDEKNVTFINEFVITFKLKK